MKRRLSQATITDISWTHLPATVVVSESANFWMAVRRTFYGHVEMQSSRISNTTYLWFVWRGAIRQAGLGLAAAATGVGVAATNRHPSAHHADVLMGK